MKFLSSIMKTLFINEDIDLSKTINISYEKIIDSKFKLVSETSYYIYENDTWQYILGYSDAAYHLFRCRYGIGGKRCISYTSYLCRVVNFGSNGDGSLKTVADRENSWKLRKKLFENERTYAIMQEVIT